MSAERLAIPDLGRIFQGGSVTGLSEWQLLERYLEGRDEAAFEAIVTRHGPMVMGVCRRVLGYSPEAEDAFQATFLVLVRRARNLGPRDAIGPWLYGVATRVAARARNQVARHHRNRAIPLEFPVPDRAGSGLDPDLVEVLDQELSRLPAKYRSPIVLCYLEGRTHEEAARDLHWPVGTVKGRLARARDLLRSRLSRRGFAPSSGVLGVLSSRDLRMIVDRSLVERTVRASVKLAAGQSVAQVVSQSIHSLANGAGGTMFYRKLALAGLAAASTGLIFTTAAVLGRQEAQPQPAEKSAIKEPARTPANSGPRRVVNTMKVDAAADGRASDPKSRMILETLEEPISMSFANETPLDDVLKYIKQATTTKTYTGIPIYVDPLGLQDAERSLNSTIQIDLEGVPLRLTLQLVLKQLDLAYCVQDGFLMITSKRRAENPLPPMIVKPTMIGQRVGKAERGELNSSELKELIAVLQLREQVVQLHEAENRIAAQRTATNPAQAKADSDEAKALLKELRELIQLLKAEKQGKKPGDSK